MRNYADAALVSMKDETLALRDLGRMNEIGARIASAQRDRLTATERFQGDLRQRTAALAETALIQAGNGHRAATLLEIAATTPK